MVVKAYLVIVDVYSCSCSELECLPEGDKFRFLHRFPSDSGQASMTESKVTTTYLAKATTICEIFYVWIANSLIG
jgi:hypothetical protein